MRDKKYIVTGETEDGWFLEHLNTEDLFEYLAVRTGDGYTDGDPIDFDDLDRVDGSIGVDTWHYTTRHERFVIIDGSVKQVKPKELVTQIEVED